MSCTVGCLTFLFPTNYYIQLPSLIFLWSKYLRVSIIFSGVTNTSEFIIFIIIFICNILSTIFTTRNMSCVKVMFSRACVKNSVHRRGVSVSRSGGCLCRHPLGKHPLEDTPLGRHPLGRYPLPLVVIWGVCPFEGVCCYIQVSFKRYTPITKFTFHMRFLILNHCPRHCCCVRIVLSSP